MPVQLAPRQPRVHYNPGSSVENIQNEPDWSSTHNHRIGFRNAQNRYAGFTHDGDHGPYEREEDRKFGEEAMRKHRELLKREDRGELINFRDVFKGETVNMVTH